VTVALEVYLRSAGARPVMGDEWIVSCPFCGKSGHLYVNVEPTDEKPAGRWLCFRCGESSRSFARLYAELEGIDISDARREVARMIIGPVSKIPVSPGASSCKTPSVAPAGSEGIDSFLPDEFVPVWDRGRWHWPGYLEKRRVPRELARAHGLGFCRRGPFANRIVFPLVCPNGKSFTARSVLPEHLQPLRYKSGPGAGALVFGWFSAEGKEEVVITEGPFDALRVLETGRSGVALWGKQLRDSQAALLRPFQRKVVLLDGDALPDALRVARRLGAGVLVATVPTDPGDALPWAVEAAIRAAKPWEELGSTDPTEKLRKSLGITRS